MNIAKVINKHYCLGCGLCVSDVGNGKLKMVEKEDGFIVPVPQNGFDGEISALHKYCPGVTIKLNRPLRSHKEKLYGPFLDLKVAHANDQTIRFRGASGGCLTAILCALIDYKKVDGVLQTGASDEFPTKTESFFSKSVEEIISNAGSRYAPASLLHNFKQIIKENNRIAIVGKPCDIAGVRQFLDIHPEYSKKIYCTLSFMCMGLPSQNATARLIHNLGIEDANQVKELKYRGAGWPGKASVITKQDESYSCSYDDSWGKVLGRDLLFRCKICPDGWGSFADISSGDAWHTDGEGPIFDEKPGRSFLFIRTSRGKEIINAITKSITIVDYDIRELPIIQKSQHARKNRLWLSYLVLKILGDRLLKFKGLGIWSRMFKKSPIFVAKEAYGLIKRLPK
ncbi:MAG: Coenzyme F420 hydrogenase/dehydrogenase, beta subunit C-terminal domain [Desulfobacterales bacterium]|nr:Coenzyme F420 hydrogenase/dehydrogenase, beta subunit C-terminal domain [Desulfobacterales bacterium]